MGTYTSISLSAPSEAEAGKTVYVTATVKNLYSTSVKIWTAVVASWDSYNRFIDVEEWVPAGATRTYSGYFTMPDKDAAIGGYTYFLATDGYYYSDDEDHETVTLKEEVTGEIVRVRVYKDGDEYIPGSGLKLKADGGSFSLHVTVSYHGPQTSGGRVYGYVYPPQGGSRYDDDPDHYTYDKPDTEHTYTIDFGSLDQEGPWSAYIAYTRTISGEETILDTWNGYIFTAEPEVVPPEFKYLEITEFIKV
jgi:hypothetical protein